MNLKRIADCNLWHHLQIVGVGSLGLLAALRAHAHAVCTPGLQVAKSSRCTCLVPVSVFASWVLLFGSQ